ncbi:MAG: hypothetical protein IKS69_02745 [Erysipelotrichaceae bacterium]|nr:hypothetical protein [Erysipelotrichaceae bacterium]MBR5755123.1 hypothetical protein [Erysipelotrichaceae bacterium]
MNCPYCGNEMIEGFVQSSEHIYFNRGNKARFFAAGDLRSKSLTRLSIRAPYVKAYMCDRCQKIIMDLKRKQYEKGIFKL